MNKKLKKIGLTRKSTRNKIQNKYYTTSVKTLLKSFLSKSKSCSLEENVFSKEQLKKEALLILNKLFSFLDKASKNSALHKNRTNKKKSLVSNIYNKL
jgi:ribosomal protein S20